MKLIYGRQLLVDLEITDPRDYGFDTFQLHNRFSNTPMSTFRNDVQVVDDYYDHDFDFFLSMNLQGEPRAGSNSNSGRRGSIDRDAWYDNSSHVFYTGWDAIFDNVASEFGSRFKGLRWNHEYRPFLFREGANWMAYAIEEASADYNDVQVNHLTEWRHYLENIAKTKPRDAYLNEGTAQEQPYNTSDYDSVKRLYRHFVDFQTQAEARMVTILAQKLGSSRKLIIYPAQRTGTVHTSAEYTMNTDQVTGSNVIREIATWDTHQYTNAVRNTLAEGQGSHDYIFALQQGGRDIEDGTHPDYHEQDRIFHRKNRVRAIVANCLNPGEGEDPWNDSFAFWNDWMHNDPDIPSDERITESEQQAYMDEVRGALT